MAKIILEKNSKDELLVGLKMGQKLVDQKSLTIGQDFDTLLITTIDKLVTENRIDRLSLKSLDISSKTGPGTVSSMVIKTVFLVLNLNF